MSDEQGKKIIVDEDFKQQVQKEKEELEQQDKQGQQPASAEDQGHSAAKLPEPDFAALVSLLATQAFFAMGLLAVDEKTEPRVDLVLAKYNIDLLSLIEEKTKGNLDDQEAKMIKDTLYQMQMAFVQVSNKTEKA